MLRLIVVGTILLLTMLPKTLSVGQMPPPPVPPSRQNPGGIPPAGSGLPDFGPSNPKIEEQQARARSTDRQKKLVADTEKLLALATELKTDVDKTNQNILSVDVIKKAEEIEKLAHSVKERMKG